MKKKKKVNVTKSLLGQKRDEIGPTHLHTSTLGWSITSAGSEFHSGFVKS